MYQLIIDDVALEQLRALPKDVRRNIGYRLEMPRRHSRATSRNWRAMNAAGGFESAIIGSCFDWTGM